ncbi:hypothetical protein [Lewinella sp. 4G2]|uniref:hypothetical protein n=1 Tax=Lewinella sp. 4G2 TaxID=1803372 RepID=UPI0007B46B90|nr:hypothetical protein [Lewinella sp. 4G2]OAV45721.1 hypothetical protein A3850_015010 [Lewinella sp. 4G2]
MTRQRIRFTSVAFIAVLAISGMSLGFLVGRSHQQDVQGASEQIQQVSANVQSGGATISRIVNGVRHMLIQ